MKLYVLRSDDIEDYSPLGVYSTEEAAWQAGVEFKREHRHADVTVVEFELDGKPGEEI